MNFPQHSIDDLVPTSILTDVRRQLDRLRRSGATQFMINIPAEDFAATMEVICRRVFTPFTPTVCGVPAAPWEQPIIGVMARADQQQTQPTLFMANGREYCLTEIED